MFTVFFQQVWRGNTVLQWFLGRKSVLMVSGKPRVNIEAEGGMKGGGLKVLSVVPERILTHPPLPLHDSTSLILQYKQISVYMRAGARNCGKDCILRNSCWGAVEHVLERLWGPVKPPLDTHQQITIYSVLQNRKRTIKNKTLWGV